MTTPDRAALIARAVSYGLQTREEDGGLLLWWPDEDVDRLMPLVWDGYDGVETWLDRYGEEGAAARSRSVPEPATGPMQQQSLFDV